MKDIGIVLQIPNETSFDEREALVALVDDWTWAVRNRLAGLGFRVAVLTTTTGVPRTTSPRKDP